jgi:GNAT superfamily N-acetyltransferase
MDIRTVRFDHPDAVKLNDEVQLEYARRYDGEGDLTFLDPEHFEPPKGIFLVAYDEQGRAVATGGWRAQERSDEGYSDGDAEIKRMYVAPDVRGQGLARRILAELEERAQAAGRIRMVLETGIAQPEAIALYESSGYRLTGKFGYYRDYETSRCYAKPLSPASQVIPS